MAAVAQLNTRMEAQLKAAGEAVLDRMGLTSTQIVRALWMKIARGPEAVDQIIDVLAMDPAAAPALAESNNTSRQSVATSFEGRLQAFYQEVGLDPSTYEISSEDEWDEWVLQDQQEEERERLISYGD